jgi:RNA polymerase-binding transcription factor DksA
MNRTALALLQGRLWQTARDYDSRLHRDRGSAGSTQPDDELQRVLRALERIDQGRYGLCEHCGQAIDPDQLFDRPQRFACAACDRSEPQ